MNTRLVSLSATLILVVISWIGNTARAEDGKGWDILNKLGYDFRASTNARHGESIYFIGKKRLAPKYPTSRDTVLRLNLATQTVEECVHREEIAKYFPERLAVNSSCFVLNPQGTMLAVGSTSVTLTPERKTETRILLLDLVEKRVGCLVDNQSDNIDYRFSPDGRFLLFRSYPAAAEQLSAAMKEAGSFSVGVVNVASGAVTILKERPRELTPFYIPKVPAAWSPDSQQVVFEYLNTSAEMDGRLEIFTCGVSDFTPKRLMKTRFGMTDLFFVDENRFIAGASDAIDLVNVKSGQSQRLVSTEKKPLSNIHRVGNAIEYGIGSEPNIIVTRVEIPAQ